MVTDYRFGRTVMVIDYKFGWTVNNDMLGVSDGDEFSLRSCSKQHMVFSAWSCERWQRRAVLVVTDYRSGRTVDDGHAGCVVLQMVMSFRRGDANDGKDV
ncbi:hypothetical protein ACLOJK_016844 [Asimina triloba]